VVVKRARRDQGKVSITKRIRVVVHQEMKMVITRHIQMLRAPIPLLELAEGEGVLIDKVQRSIEMVTFAEELM
jgi:hypothetical protein